MFFWLACTGAEVSEPRDTATCCTDTAVDPIDDTGDGTLLASSCEVPAELAHDPLTQTAFFESQPKIEDQFMELNDLHLDVETGRILAWGQSGLQVFTQDGDTFSWDAHFDGTFWRYYEGAELPDDKFVFTHREHGWEVLDLKDLDDIRVVAFEAMQGAGDVVWVHDRLYMTSFEGELIVWDLSQLSNPVEVTRVGGLGSAWEMLAIGQALYVADNQLGLVVFNISDPDAPELLTTVETAGGAQDLAYDDGLLAVATGSAGVQLFELPSQVPEPVATVPLGAAVVTVDVSGDLVWAGNHEDVVVIDASDPSAPVTLAAEKTPEWSLHVEADGDTVYVADWGNLVRYDLDDSARAPEADVSRSELRLPGSTSLELANRGAEDLRLVGASVDDERITVSVDRTSVAPGEAAEVTLTFDDDGSPVDATLCLATDDGDEPVVEVALSTGAGDGAAVGAPAIDFTLTDIDGQTWTLSEHVGSPVMLVFFATW